MDDDLTARISLPELADELQCRKQNLFKIAKRLGISPIKRRDSDRRNQQVSTVTPDEALIIKREVLNGARTTIDGSGSDNLVADDGVFYLIQLEPDHDPGRMKLGFTTDLDGRLRKHRCAAPFAKCIKTWPCRRVWERAAIDCVAAGLEQLHTEVFRAISLDVVSERADRFFSIMPAVSISIDDDDKL